MTPEEKKKKYPLYQRDCTLCGAPLAFGKTHEGKMVPLDLRSPVFAVVYERSSAHSEIQIVRTDLAFVSHYKTCPYADEF